jgi:hypothetical protein
LSTCFRDTTRTDSIQGGLSWVRVDKDVIWCGVSVLTQTDITWEQTINVNEQVNG